MFFPSLSNDSFSNTQMESGWRNSFNSSCSGGGGSGGDGSGGQNSNFTNNAWDVWDIGTTAGGTAPAGTTRYDWSNHDACAIPADTVTTARGSDASVVHALLFGVTNNNNIHQNHQLYAGAGSIQQRMPDPHMMCLKLGKRHYCEDAVVPDQHVTAEPSSTKRGKPPYPYDMSDTTASPTITIASSPASVPRCQVEGCHMALSNAKEYYRRHKVCEIHSKAPKVVVLGLQQRFCQQCSRFHGVAEFDEAKRSCRRRLEGHNQRRRKGTLSHSLPRNFPHSHENNVMIKGRLQPLSILPPSPPHSKPGCALSLLSSSKIEPWVPSSDLSSRCSAALCELIAENRAAPVFGHFWNQNSSHQPVIENAIHTIPNTQMWDRFDNAGHTTMTLDLMQAPASGFGLLPVKDKSKDSEECTDYCWSAFGGTNVV